MEILQIIITLIIFILLVIPMGKYLYNVISGEKSFVDPVMDKVDNLIYKVSGIKEEEMNWKQYAISLVVFNPVMTLFAYIILRIQGLSFLKS